MSNASVILDRDFVIGAVDPRLYGGFAEHLGRHIYTGLYEPGHPSADGQGFRTDVLELVRELDMPVMRYPGGNFVSGYDWEDGVGPRDERPVRLDLAWKTTETNQFGTDEFMDWCRKASVEPMLAVNLGTRGPDEARCLLEYCNHPGGSYYSDLRRANGHAQPHNVRLWCLGNEMDGPWQMGHKTPAEYGRVASETARLMKKVDPELELVVCGSSNGSMPTFGQWELEVLDHCYEDVDYLSVHSYFGKTNDDSAALLAWSDHMDDYIENTVSLVDAARARRKARKWMYLAFDEYNIMHMARPRTKAEPWEQAPIHHEDVYTVEDAVALGGLIISLLNHADRVKIGCLAQVVNVIAPIMTEPGGGSWKQTIFHPFAQASRWARGTVLRPIVTSTTFDATNGEGFAHLKLAAVRTDDEGLTLLAINRDLDEPLALEVDVRSFGPLSVDQWQTLCDDDRLATNSLDEPDRVVPRPGGRALLDGGKLSVHLPPASWNLICLAPVGS
jgi:alpha-N-arabinofuranosidase